MKIRDIAPYGVRMSAELKERLQSSAKVHGRSLNAEITQRLEASFNESESLTPDSALAEELQTQKQINLQLLALVDILKKTDQARDENVALIKQHVKMVTGYDIQEFFNKTVDYEAIRKKPKNENTSE